MQPIRRMITLCQSSQCQHVLKLTYKHGNCPSIQHRFYCTAGEYKYRKSALFAKRQRKVNQENIPVELDIDIEERLKVKGQLLSELSSRNIHDIDVDQLERDYENLKELEKRELELEGQKRECTKKVAILFQAKKENVESSADIEKELKNVVEIGRKTKKQIKDLFPEVTSTAERVAMTSLNLPNRLHQNTPLSEDKVEENFGIDTDKSESLSHIEIGELFDLIKFSNVGNRAFYFKDSLALLEHALTNYFCEGLRHDGYTQLTCPEFFKSLIVEGCGIESEQVLKLKQRPENPSDDYLAGMSIMSFIAYVAKSRINLTNEPLKYFSCGRSYTPETQNHSSGLFHATQSVKVNMFSMCRDWEICDSLLQTEKNNLWNIYKQFNIPCRLVTISSPLLHRSEEMRIEIQFWAKSLHKYLKVSSVSMVSDYISRRLMTRHYKGTLPVYMVHCEALDVTRLIAILIEYGAIQQDTYSFPDLEFLDKYWIHPK
ncbi:serine--tRNA synthetase-like protein Slimp [Mytilus californianus]|uniref:serine--tRNA synthetase-like protein Slimp n=1 Tax=Mytilus californianus TaxID=6549 RepID=UPI002246E6D4|nr:serine--tRNA synthetase-like protein Slimp [Mytilus californianus]